MNKRKKKALKRIYSRLPKYHCPYCMNYRRVKIRKITDEERKGFGIIIIYPIGECVTCGGIWSRCGNWANAK